MRRVICNAVLAASVIPTVYTLPAHAQGPAQALEQVVVSAQRRAQSLQDVPISIAAFSNAAIQNFRIQNLTDLNTLGPIVAGYYEFPRSYGLDLTYEY